MAGLPTELRRVQMPLSKKVWPALGLFALRVRSVSGNSRRHRDDSPDTSSPAFAPSQILYFEFTRAGDLICATPFLAVLRRRWPEARITLAVYKEVAEVARGLPEVDRVETFDRSNLLESMKHLWRMRHAPDTLILSHSINPLVAVYLLATDAPAYAGYLWSHACASLPGEGVNLRPVARPFGHLIEQRLDIARILGLAADDAPPVRFSVRAGEVRPDIAAALEDAAVRRNAGMRIVTISPGSRTASKQWPLRDFLIVGRSLAERKDTVMVIVGGPGDARFAGDFRALAPESVVDLAGRTDFAEFAAVIEASDLVICNDSAALHLAAAFRTPCVALFGPVNPDNVVHRFPGYATRGLVGTEKCLCGYNVFAERPCPHSQPCMASISSERVIVEARAILDATPPAK